MPANTLREELAGILTSSHYGGQEDDGWTDEELTEAVDAILLAIKNRLPKETAHGDDWQFLDRETQSLQLVRDNVIREVKEMLGGKVE